jgi:hypothetical protein
VRAVAALAEAAVPFDGRDGSREYPVGQPERAHSRRVAVIEWRLPRAVLAIRYDNAGSPC